LTKEHLYHLNSEEGTIGHQFSKMKLRTFGNFAQNLCSCQLHDSFATGGIQDVPFGIFLSHVPYCYLAVFLPFDTDVSGKDT